METETRRRRLIDKYYADKRSSREEFMAKESLDKYCTIVKQRGTTATDRRHVREYMRSHGHTENSLRQRCQAPLKPHGRHLSKPRHAKE